MEIFYLFSVRYVHGTSLTPRGVMGIPAVLIGVGTVIVSQAVFTYLPFMQQVFKTHAVTFVDGAAIIGVGVAVLFLVELEKRIHASLVARA